MQPRKRQRRQQQVLCRWVPREFSEAEQRVPGRAAPAARGSAVIEAAMNGVLVTD